MDLEFEVTPKINNKIFPIEELEKITLQERENGKKVVLCHGVFDLVHPGHILHLKSAKRLGDVLVVTVTPDRFVNKGPNRPYFNERLRAETIAAIECVDYVALNEWPTAEETILHLKPQIYAKGSEYANTANDLTGKIEFESSAVRQVGGEVVFTMEETFSSSNLLNQFFAAYPPEAYTFLKKFREKYSADRIISSIRSLKDLRVTVIGEAILDQYCYCAPLGMSPKEGIVTTKFQSEENFAGGALATANHLAGFCKEIDLVTCLGGDGEQRDIISSMLLPNILLHAVMIENRPTITKRRFIEPGFLKKMFEIQWLDDSPLSPVLEKKVIKHLIRSFEKTDMVVITDYGHGLFSETLRDLLYDSKKFLALNVQANSSNFGFNLVTKYNRADYISIDEIELKLASKTQYGHFQESAKQVLKQLNASRVMITRGAKGALLINHKEEISEVPVLSTKIVDRVGAGDAFFAVTSPCAYRNFNDEAIGFIGNCAGALAVNTICNKEPVSPVVLYKFISSLLK